MRKEAPAEVAAHSSQWKPFSYMYSILTSKLSMMIRMMRYWVYTNTYARKVLDIKDLLSVMLYSA